MDNKIRTRLLDVSNAIGEIYTFLPVEVSFDVFRNDIKTQRAIERNLEIIGEAIGEILKIDPDIQISNARRIVDTRNRIIHGYDTVSAEIIWTISRKDIILLDSEIRLIITQS